ncbi:ribonuclease H-like domain-containing protein [Tanacetum coccineum]
MRMKQYLTYTDYALWEVIVNGDAPDIALASTEGPIPPKIAKQKLARKNKLKAKSTLLLAIPDEHLLKFHGIKDAKTLWKAMKTRFGGNKELKKMQKTILKQQYENFTASRSEGLDKTYDRSLLLAWNNIALIMRNKSDLDTMSMDNLYNNLKVYEAKIKSQSSSSLNSQNVAFVSSKNISSTNEAVNTAHEVSTANLQGQASSSSYAEDVMFSFFVSGHAYHGSEEILKEDMKKSELQWQRNCSSSSSSSDSEVTTCSNACLKSYESLKEHFDRQKEQLKKSNLEIIGKDNFITKLKNQLAEALREKDDLKHKLENFETSSKNLTDLLNSQISVNNKTGISFDSQMTENELHDIHKNNSEVFESASDSSVNKIEEENNQVNDRFKKVEGYHAVPPPYTRNYMPSRPDLSFARLDDSVYKTNVSETITSVHRNESTASKFSKDNLEQPKDVRPSAPIVEEQAENLRKSQSPRVDKRNWNGLMTQKLKDGFEFNKKACFVCGSLNYLIKDCNFYENKMVGKSMLDNMGRVTGQREVRPVWNNAQMVNYQNKLTHPHPKRNFIPTPGLTKSGNVLVNTAKHSSSRATISNSTTRYVNAAASRPTMNGAKPCSNVFHKSHLSVKRTIYQRTSPKNSDFKEKVNTAKVNNVTTAETKAVVSAIQGHEENAVKSSACWIWRPTGKDQGIFDSGCSRHMTENKSYLPDYQDINGVFVTFVGSPKGDFKLLDKSQSTIDESNLWHRRLVHVNFKTMNKLVKGNLVRGLPSKVFENDHTYVACQKGKQHKAFCKTKLVSSISQPLQILHMDLFGPTFVKSLNKKMYCLVVTDDFSRFSWVFFLAFKDETSEILKPFIIGIENQINHKVKIIRCDNGTEFKNSEMNQFCEMKGIKREFSVARTPQQN